MKYGMLLWPHANARYQTEAAKLASAELDLILKALSPGAVIHGARADDIPLLEFEAPNRLSDADISKICRHSMNYILFEICDTNMKIVRGRAEPYLFDDLAGILKYKGKTNELFTLLTINIAVYSSDFREISDKRLNFLDPMCARGTSLFQAVNMGWNAYGGDISASDIRELTRFFKRYLEYHKLKHSSTSGSSTTPLNKGAPWTEFAFASDADKYKSGDVSRLRAATCDCAYADSVFGKNKFHVISCDLPYGVQHAPGGMSIDMLVAKSIPRWRAALKPGGAISISFNTNIIKTKRLREIIADGGLEVMSGGAYDKFEHWVEQAVNRDVAVARRSATY